MELVRLLTFIALGQMTVCLKSSSWTKSSKYYPATTGHFQYWTSLPQCVKVCLDRKDCNAIVIKAGAKGTRRPCWLVNDRLVSTQDTMPSEFLVYVARTSDAGGSTTDVIPSSRRAELKDRAESAIRLNTSLSLAVLQQYTGRNGWKHALYLLDPKTWTFIKRTVTISGNISRAMMDFNQEEIYWFEYLQGSKCYTIKSVSLRDSTTRLVNGICIEYMDIDIEHNTLYFAQKVREGVNVFKNCIEDHRLTYTFLRGPKRIHSISTMYTLSCLRVIKERLYWCSNHLQPTIQMHIKDLTNRETTQSLILKPKDADIHIFPYKEHIYWTDTLGSFSVSSLKDRKTERLSGCGSTVRSLGSLGRYGGLWYLTCYTGKLTEIHFYDDNMKKVKSLQVEYEAIVALCDQA